MKMKLVMITFDFTVIVRDTEAIVIYLPAQPLGHQEQLPFILIFNLDVRYSK